MVMSRAERVGDLLKEELSEVLLREIKDPRIGFVTITGVRVSDDLRHARVYVVTHETGEGQQRTLEGLQSARGYLRGALGRRVRLRYIPDLSFWVDESLEQGFRIHEILKSLETGGRPDEE
ncbi:MAG: 30S ribosome-binding factor RbfA [candidate division NC10 bacterium]|nr:30S ribosome-binding factor RbfA [candidate division NC10 bacterium]